MAILDRLTTRKPALGHSPMLLPPRRHAAECDGDFTRRRARYALLLFLCVLPLTLWLFARAAQLWFKIVPLEGATFMVAATAFGLAFAIFPVFTVIALLAATWYGVESVYLPRTHATPTADRIIIALGMLIWFAPTLALCAAVLRAILAGSIRFSRPAREYVLATDPIAFWQSMGFMLIVALALAYPAWRYWRGKHAGTGTLRPQSGPGS